MNTIEWLQVESRKYTLVCTTSNNETSTDPDCVPATLASVKRIIKTFSSLAFFLNWPVFDVSFDSLNMGRNKTGWCVSSNIKSLTFNLVQTGKRKLVDGNVLFPEDTDELLVSFHLKHCCNINCSLILFCRRSLQKTWTLPLKSGPRNSERKTAIPPWQVMKLNCDLDVKRWGRKGKRKEEAWMRTRRRRRGGDEGAVRGGLEHLTPATFVKQIKRCRGSSPVRATHTHTRTHTQTARAARIWLTQSK